MFRPFGKVRSILLRRKDRIRVEDAKGHSCLRNTYRIT